MSRKSRNTKQKEIINKEIEKINDFFTSEDLYNIIKKKHPEIGLATIYRFMKELRKNNRIHAYTCNYRLLYSKDKKSHCHFFCEETEKVFHFDVDSLDFLKNKIPGSISSIQIEIKGKCGECSIR
jgi:Fur family ferric uptake transcriptional regulator|tara:strand:- start:1151 stop:1525 length:375 start_codon:yes stop_codon:yes gene_type:complete